MTLIDSGGGGGGRADGRPRAAEAAMVRNVQCIW